MKDVFKARPKDGPQGEPLFWERFSGSKALLLLLCALLLGVAVGAALAVFFPLFQGRWVMPLQFSGIPVAGSGFISCFSTLLLNVLIGLVPLFLLGVTAFGVFAVPLFLFFRGITVGIGVSYFLWRDELLGLARSALLYTPAAAAAGGFSPEGVGSLDLKLYFHDLMLFLSFSVAVSLAGCLPVLVYGLFL